MALLLDCPKTDHVLCLLKWGGGGLLKAFGRPYDLAAETLDTGILILCFIWNLDVHNFWDTAAKPARASVILTWPYEHVLSIISRNYFYWILSSKIFEHLYATSDCTLESVS